MNTNIALKNQMLRALYLSRINKAMASGLSLIREAQTLKEVLPFCNNPSAKIRREVAKKLMNWLDNSQASHLLVNMLDDKDEQVRWYAALSLGEGAQLPLPKLQNLLASRSPEKWQLASIMLRKQVPPELKSLLIQGLSAEEKIRNLAIYLLDKSGEIALVKSSVNDPSPAIRDTILTSLIATQEKSELAIFLADSDQYIRARATRSLNPSSRVVDASAVNLYQSTLLGQAIGDALGAPIEFSSLKDIESIGGVDNYLKDPGRPLNPGDYTDDTQMALMVTKSILRTGGVNPTDVAAVMAAFGLALDLEQTRNLGYSNTTLISYRRLYAGLNWRLSAEKSNGCGPSTAITPLGLIIRDLSELTDNVAGITLITKTGSEALGGALAIAYLINQSRWAHLPPSPATIIKETADFVEKSSPLMAQEIRRLTSLLPLPTIEALNQIPHNADGNKIKIGMKALGVVPSAIYCFIKTLTDYPQTILAAIHTEGDSDSIAALAGALSGTYNGLPNIPTTWLDGLTEKDEIVELSQKLANSLP